MVSDWFDVRWICKIDSVGFLQRVFICMLNECSIEFRMIEFLMKPCRCFAIAFFGVVLECWWKLSSCVEFWMCVNQVVIDENCGCNSWCSYGIGMLFTCMCNEGFRCAFRGFWKVCELSRIFVSPNICHISFLHR